MCGIVGIAGDLAYKDEATMKRLLVLDVFRGVDSTGLAAVRTGGEVKIGKLASHPFDLFDVPKFKDALNGNASRAFIGHNRAATKGVVNTYNAHPFQFDHITGVHNGTLHHTSHKALEDALGEKFNVDSQAIFAAISKLGVKEAFKLIEGAWSIVYHNAMDGSINFLRNKERPMWYAYTKDFKRLIWASEWPMIEAAMRMGQGYEVFKEDKTGYQFFSTQEDLHYSWELQKLKDGSTARPKPVVFELKGKEPAPVSYVSTGGHDPFQRTTTTNMNGGGQNTSRNAQGNITQLPMLGTTTNSPGTTPSKNDNSPPSERIVHLLGDATRPFAGLITPESFASMSKHGCGFCKKQVSIHDQGITIYERDDLVLCTECTPSSATRNTRIYTKIDLQL
jgi:hypothetical protein